MPEALLSTSENFSTNENFEGQAAISGNDENLNYRDATMRMDVPNLSDVKSDENILQNREKIVLDVDKK